MSSSAVMIFGLLREEIIMQSMVSCEREVLSAWLDSVVLATLSMLRLSSDSKPLSGRLSLRLELSRRNRIRVLCFASATFVFSAASCLKLFPVKVVVERFIEATSYVS